MKRRIVVGLDCGNQTTGIAIVVNDSIECGLNVPNSNVYDIVVALLDDGDVTVVIEDVRPYGVRLSQDLIDTCKFIGELQYRLRGAEIPYVLIARATVRAWVFKAHYEAVEPYIVKNIERRERIMPAEKKRSISFLYVDDRAVIAAMKQHWGIPTPKPGKSNKYGLKSHAWQALSVATHYIVSLQCDAVTNPSRRNERGN